MKSNIHNSEREKKLRENIQKWDSEDILFYAELFSEILDSDITHNGLMTMTGIENVNSRNVENTVVKDINNDALI